MADTWKTCETFTSPGASAWRGLDQWIGLNRGSASRWETARPGDGAALCLDLDSASQLDFADRLDSAGRAVFGALEGGPASEPLTGELLFFEAQPEAPASLLDDLLRNLPGAALPSWIAGRSAPRSEDFLLTESGSLQLPTGDRWILYRPAKRAASLRRALSRGPAKVPEGNLQGRADWFKKRHGGDLS